MTNHWPERVLVLGSGAMASLVGARLAAAGGVRVTLAGTWRAALDAIARNGICVHDDTGIWAVRVGVRELAPIAEVGAPGTAGAADRAGGLGTAVTAGGLGAADHDGGRGAADRAGGLGAASTVVPVRADASREVSAGIESSSADLVVVLVKSDRTATVALHAARALASGGIVLTLQNGLGNGEALAAEVGVERIAVGVTGMGAHLLAPGVVADGGSGPTVIGPGGVAVDDVGLAARLAWVASVFTAAGMPTDVHSDVRAPLWRKLAANCAINPLAALMGVPNGALVEDPSVRAILVAAAREVEAVAAGLGIALGGDAAELALDVARQTAGNRCSMLQDLARGAPTEISAINGAVVAEGRRLGVETPVNAALVELVRAAEAGRQTRPSTVPTPALAPGPAPAAAPVSESVVPAAGGER